MFLSTQKYLFMLDLNSANVSKFIEIKEYNGEEIYTTSYSYDVLGNLVGIVDEEGNEWVFEYDSLGRKVSDIDPDIGVSNYTYDLNGNLINEIRSHGGLIQDKNFIRSYNELGQLVNISLLNGTLIEEYVYDGNGDRVKSYNAVKNETVYTPFKEFMQIRNSEGIFNYTYIYEGETLVARINSDGSKYFYHPDFLGSTTLITDESGNVVEDNYYLPYGELVGESDEVKLYEGMEYSEDIGEYDYNFRNYNPSYGIFLKADSILPDVYDPQQLNRYLFERGNPYGFVDESGHAFTLYHSIGTSLGLASLGDFSGALRSLSGVFVVDFNPEEKYYQNEFGLSNKDFHFGPASDGWTDEKVDTVLRDRAQNYVDTDDTRYLHAMGDSMHPRFPSAGASASKSEKIMHAIMDFNPFLIIETFQNTRKYVGEIQDDERRFELSQESYEDLKENTF